MKYLNWRVCGIFTKNRGSLLRQTAGRMISAAGLDNIVYLCSQKTAEPVYTRAFHLETITTSVGTVVNLITPGTVLIFDDIETIRHYPCPMTRTIIKRIAPLARFKIVGGSALLTNYLYDLYSEFAVLDKKILAANHYWCFKAEHREVSVFDGTTVMPNKDIPYLAAKLKPFIFFDLEPENELQDRLYAAIRAAKYQKRMQDVSNLRLR